MQLPSYDDLPVSEHDPPYRRAWEVFPPNGLGTLNTLTAERRRAAAALIASGRAIGLDHPLDLDLRIFASRRRYRRTEYELMAGGFYDEVIDGFSPQLSSQWDGLGHVRSADGFYGGVMASGASAQTHAAGIGAVAQNGIAGRGVLLDVAHWYAQQGQPLDPNLRCEIPVELLDRVAQRQGVEIKPGDILLLRFGVDQALHDIRDGRSAPESFRMDCPGLAQSEQTLRWLWNHQLAAVCSDNVAVEVTPSLRFEQRLHPRLIGLLGVTLGELFDLRELALACRELGRYEFFFAGKPWFVPGGLGSPANAAAIL